MKSVGLITIGQSPRDDTVPGMEKILGPGFRVLQAGALDGLSRPEIDALAPATPADALVTRLRDGATVVIAKTAILGRLQGCLDRLAPEVTASVVLCTGTFPRFTTTHPILFPDRILFGAVQALLDDGVLGVVVPLVEQVESYRTRWSRMSPRVWVTVASPYRGPGELVRAADDLRAAGASLVVLDCMGFVEASKDTMRDLVNVPVLLPTALVARFLAEVA